LTDADLCNPALDLADAAYIQWAGRGNQTPPAPMGGPIAPGDYVLSAINLYGPTVSDSGTQNSTLETRGIEQIYTK